jgi:hypothetical protein
MWEELLDKCWNPFRCVLKLTEKVGLFKEKKFKLERRRSIIHLGSEQVRVYLVSHDSWVVQTTWVMAHE